MTVGQVNIYAAGTLVRVRGAFTSRQLNQYETGVFHDTGTLPAGVGVDPPSVACTVKRPDATEVSVPVVRDGQGAYHADVDTTGLKGQWHVHIYSPAGQVNQGAGEGRFQTELDV